MTASKVQGLHRPVLALAPMLAGMVLAPANGAPDLRLSSQVPRSYRGLSNNGTTSGDSGLKAAWLG